MFSILFTYHSFHTEPKWFSTLCNEWSGFNVSDLLTGMMSFFVVKKTNKKNPCNTKVVFVLNDLICIFIMYMYIYIHIHKHDKKGVIHIYMNNPFLARSVSLFRLEQRSLSVGKNFGLAKTLGPIGNLVPNDHWSIYWAWCRAVFDLFSFDCSNISLCTYIANVILHKWMAYFFHFVLFSPLK